MKTLLMLSALGLMAASTDTPDAGGDSQAAAKKAAAEEAAAKKAAAEEAAAKKAAAEEAAAKKAAKSKVKVKVLCAALGEDGKDYLKNEVFEATADRAAALGDSVELVK